MASQGAQGAPRRQIAPNGPRPDDTHLHLSVSFGTALQCAVCLRCLDRLVVHAEYLLQDLIGMLAEQR